MNAHAGMNQAFIATLITLTSSKILGLNQAQGPEPGKVITNCIFFGMKRLSVEMIQTVILFHIALDRSLGPLTRSTPL